MQCNLTYLNPLQKYFNTAVQLELRVKIHIYTFMYHITILGYENCITNTTDIIK